MPQRRQPIKPPIRPPVKPWPIGPIRKPPIGPEFPIKLPIKPIRPPEFPGFPIRKPIPEEELEEQELPDYSGDINELKESLTNHTHKGLETPRIRIEDIIGKLDSACRAYRDSSSQTIGTGNWIKLQLNAETFDIGNNFDSTTNYRFTVTNPGYYDIKAAVYWGIQQDNTGYNIAIYKNGSAIAHGYGESSSTDNMTVAVADFAKLDAGDYIEIYVHHEKGTDQTINPNSNRTYFSIYKIY